MEVEKQKKDKMKRLFIWAGLIVLILFVITTSIVLNSKNKELKKIKDDYEIVKPSEEIIRIVY